MAKQREQLATLAEYMLVLQELDAARAPQQFCPQAPTERQSEFLARTEFEALFGGSAGGGKMLPVDLPLPTPSGWVNVGDVRVGDEVFSESGAPIRVTHVHPIDLRPESWRLTFDDGTQIECCGDHLWHTFTADDLLALTKRTPEWRAARRAKRPSRVSGRKSARFAASLAARNAARPPPCKAPPTGAIRTTREVAATLRVGKRANHAIPVAGALQCPEADLPLDPYAFGVWLGDGTSTAGTITTADPEMVEVFHRVGFKAGAVLKKPKNRAATHSFHGLVTLLRRMGVHANKHIPAAYLRACRDQRLALLQGLMDTDGTVCESGAVEFTTTSQALAYQTHELVLSLGWKARLVESVAKLHGRIIGPKWDIKWTPDEHVFRLARKRDRQRLATRRTTRFRYIVAAERVEPKPMRCITVDNPTGLFLAGREMVPTHNSSALLIAALQYVHVPGYSALILRRTFTDLSLPGSIMDRAREWLSRTSATWNDRDKRWTFPSGATLQFGYCDTDRDRYRYQGTEVQFLGIDEATQWPEGWYRYLLSRLRRRENLNVPLRARLASNPGGIGHHWVRRRFVDPSTAVGAYVPARLDDNPHLDREGYRRSLELLDATTRAQLLDGIWVADGSGLVYPYDPTRCDVAATPELTRHVLGIDYGVTDATAFVVVGWREHDPTVYVVHAEKTSKTIPSEAAQRARELAARYRVDRIVGDEGGLGKGFAEEARRRFGVPIQPAEKTNKRGYQSLLAGALERGEVRLLMPQGRALAAEWAELPWNDTRTHEAEGFENHASDACLYAWRAAGAYREQPDAQPATVDERLRLEDEQRRRAIEERMQRTRDVERDMFGIGSFGGI